MKKVARIISKIVLWSIGIVLLLLIAVVLLIRLPSVQLYITQKAVTYVSSKTHTRVELKKLYIAFPKSVVIEGLFAEDLQHDTLISVNKIRVDIGMLGLLKNKLDINSVFISGLNGNISRSLPDSSFNFDFFIDAFAGDTPKPEKVKEKDTTSAPMRIAVGKVELEDIRVTYLDAVSGNDLALVLGKLDVNMDDMDLQAMKFHVNKVFISGVNARFVQTKASVSTDTTSSPLPDLGLKELKLENVALLYDNQVNGQRYECNAGSLLLRPGEMDIPGQKIRLDQFDLQETTILIAMRKSKDTLAVVSEPETAEPGKGWDVSAESIGLDKVNFRYDVTNVPRKPSGMDYDHLFFTNVHIDLKNTSYTTERIATDIKDVSLREQSGLNLQKLSAKVVYDDTHAEISGLILQTPHTRLADHLEISYASIASLSEHLGDMTVKVQLKNSAVGLEDILLFVPDLKKQPLFARNKGQVLKLSGNVDGMVKDLLVHDLKLSTATNTAIALNANIKGLPDAGRAVYDLDLKGLHTSKTDIHSLLPAGMLPPSVEIPEQIELKGFFKGSVKDFVSEMNLQTTSGEVFVDARMRDVSGQPAYELGMDVKELNLGYILKDPKMYGMLTMRAVANGQSFDPKQMRADVRAEISRLGLNSYTYTGITLDAKADHEHYTADVRVNDSNLLLALNADLVMVKDQEAIKVDLNLEGADLYALNVGAQKIRASGSLAVDLKGKDAETMNGTVNLGNIVLLKGQERYRIDSFLVATINEEKHSALKVKSAMFALDYEGSLAVVKLSDAITNHINHYFTVSEKDKSAADTSGQAFKLSMKVFPHPVFNEVLFPQLNEFDGADLNVEFDNQKQKMDLELDVPVLQFGANRVSDVKVAVNSDKNAINYDVNFSRLSSGTVNLPLTRLAGALREDSVTFALNISEKNTDKLLIAGNVSKKEDAYLLRLDRNNLVFNNEKWTLPEDNYVMIEPKGFYIHDLVLENNTQVFSVRSKEMNVNAPLDIRFDKFELGTLSQIIEKDTAIVRGLLNGSVELKDLHATPSFISDLKIENIVFRDNPVGDLSVKADNASENRYTAKVVLSGNDNDVVINGYYGTAGKSNNLNFEIDVNKLNIASVESFTGGQIRRSKGYVNGNLKLTGTAEKPEINGDIGFKDAAFNVAYINNYLQMKDERIRIAPDGIYFNSFSIIDSLGHPATIKGAIYTKDFTKMRFDMDVTMNNFTVLNTNAKDNPLYYGRIILDSDIRIRGTESLPKVNANIKLLKGSALTVVVPSSELSIDRGDGVIVFIDTSSNPIMNRMDTVQTALALKGIDMTANIEIDKQTSFKVIVDKTSGDSLVAKGSGVLSFSLDPSGKQSLSGRYELNDGSYRASFKKVVKREFDIKPGSSLVWGGDPLDALIDITAIYRAKTSAVDLLASELSATDASERNAYRKLLNFDVNLIIKGKLLQPEISFELDMPDNEKNAFGGAVYSKITALNNDPNELNKQVFSLLVLNKFLPSGNSSSASAGSAVNTVARNSVNQALSDQLNSLSGKYVKGVELNFDIQSNDDYTSSGVQENTEVQIGLKKELFNSRLSVQVGSSVNLQENDPQRAQSDNMGGDVIVEYKITEDGRYRFKAFRENQYEGIIDGLLYRTGLGITYTRDYNKFRDLFSKPKSEKELEKEEEAKRKAQQERDRKKNAETEEKAPVKKE